MRLLHFIHSMQHSIRNVYAYSALEYEVDLDLFFQIAQRKGINIWLPATCSTQSKVLNFYRWTRGEALVAGRFNILEPDVTQSNIKTTTLDIPDMLIIPLVAFNKAFHRLGKGGGYYDYTISHIPQYSRAHRVCCAFSIQECDNITVDSHDIPVDTIITEKTIMNKCNNV